MVKREFETPPSLPATTIKRCLEIPTSKEWLGIFNSALLSLAQSWNYEQVHDTDLSPEDVAAICFNIYVQYLAGECGLVDVRQNEADPCILEKSGDGETWEPFANLQLCPPLVQRNPQTGNIEFTTDAGLTWFEVPDGPWVDDYPEVIIAPQPQPSAVEGVDNQRCVAAANATLAMQSFYLDTFVQFSNNVSATVVNVSNFIAQFTRFLLQAYWPDAYTIGRSYGIWEERDAFVSGGLTEEQQDEFRCILFLNSTVDENGVVNFDFATIAADVIALGAVPWLPVWLLLQYWQEAGLNVAGGIRAVDEAFCNDCDDAWCYRFDFSVSNGGFVSYQNIAGQGGAAYGNQGGNTAWHDVSTNSGGVLTTALMIKRTFDPTVITRMQFNVSFFKGATQGGGSFHLRRNGVVVFNNSPLTIPDGNNQVFSYDVPDIEADEIRLQVFPCSGCNGGSALVGVMEYEGAGTNPFGEDNC